MNKGWRRPRNAPWSICEATGKRGYTSRDAAHSAMRAAGNKVRVYRCPKCHGWHVTSNPRREPTRKAGR